MYKIFDKIFDNLFYLCMCTIFVLFPSISVIIFTWIFVKTDFTTKSI